jgi:hypothetical protein
MSLKTRLTVTIDPDLVEAGTAAVAAGEADSLSAWVNVALAERVVKQQRLRALGEAIAAHETAYGVITAEELVAQQRADRAAARVPGSAGATRTASRGAGSRRGSRRRRRGAA